MFKTKHFVVLLFLTYIVNIAYSQNDPVAKAKGILDAVKKKYQSIKAFKADFTYQITSEGQDVEDELKGSITVKGAKFYLKLPEQEIFTDARKQWTYLKDANEILVGVYEPDADEITPDKVYTIYEKNYKYTWVEDQTVDGKTYHIIDLTPKKREDSQIFKLRLKVVQSSKSIKSWEIFEKNSNRYLYNITRFATVKVSDNYFKYSASRFPSNPELIE